MSKLYNKILGIINLSLSIVMYITLYFYEHIETKLLIAIGFIGIYMMIIGIKNLEVGYDTDKRI